MAIIDIVTDAQGQSECSARSIRLNNLLSECKGILKADQPRGGFMGQRELHVQKQGGETAVGTGKQKWLVSPGKYRQRDK